MHLAHGVIKLEHTYMRIKVSDQEESTFAQALEIFVVDTVSNEHAVHAMPWGTVALVAKQCALQTIYSPTKDHRITNESLCNAQSVSMLERKRASSQGTSDMARQMLGACCGS